MGFITLGGGGGGEPTDHVAIGHSYGEGVGGDVPPPTKREAKNAYYSEVSQICP